MIRRVLFVLALPALVQAQGVQEIPLEPTDDTWANHDDDQVHGAEEALKVGVEPQGCQSAPGYDPCPNDDLVCCTVDDGYNYCAEDGACAETTPSWTAFRKHRGYLRFPVDSLPGDVKIVEARLELRQVMLVEKQGGPLVLEVHRLKQIGLDPPICAWTEETLSDTNGTTWSSLVQNTSVAADGTWTFDVTKAVRDWVEGDSDDPGAGPVPNCGFVAFDPGFGSAASPLERWATFHAKEGAAAPRLVVTVARDEDDDGWYADLDCDETDADVHPGATELCNLADDDCDGTADDEQCDSIDNDCDGATDEQTDCGSGQVCIGGTCELTCQDECAGPTDSSCLLLDDGIWQRLGCGQADDDPCLDWIPGPTCPEGWSCGYGSCSSNCLDDEGCSADGETFCEQTPAGDWVTITCGQHDADECLDRGPAVPCGKGAQCAGGACTGEPCEDACEAGAQQCTGEGGAAAAQVCWTWDGPCTSWSDPAACAAGEQCHEGVCAGAAPCEHACEGPDHFGCSESGDEALGCGQHDEDPCLDWGVVDTCQGGWTCVPGTGHCDPTVPDCMGECPQDAVICADVGEVVRTCIKPDDQPCRQWQDTVCEAGETCQDGACVSVPAEPVMTEVVEGVETSADAGPVEPDTISGEADAGSLLPDAGDGDTGSAPATPEEDGGCQASPRGGVPGAVPLAFVLLLLVALRRQRA